MRELSCRAPIILAFVVGLSVGGCGGGGGGSGSSTPYAEITSANAAMVAGYVVSGVAGSARFGGDDKQVFGGSDGAGAGLASVSARAARKALWRGTGPTIAVSIPPQTEPCLVSGTVTVSGEVANPETLTAGDRLLATFNDCDDGVGDVADGEFNLTIRQFEGDIFSDEFLLDADATLGEFTLTEDGDVLVADGDIRLRIDTRQLPLTTGRMSGNRFELTGGGTTDILTDFSIDLSFNDSTSPAAVTTDGHGTLANDALGGKVDFEITVTFEGLEDDNPEGGELLITGRDGAQIRLTALDTVNVRLELDLDANGDFEETQNTTWAALGD